ncbi:MAG: ABC transporter ATP-binding protein [Candidatus Verstraetearchaeota archaeon]|nr:ABC transporter ATP-binding protein [Candidatus Verstraetearchaeota archaeon]
MIELKGVNAGYGKFHVLFDIDLKFEKGKATVVVGPNGSGKSTMLKTIFGLTSVYSGGVFFKGEEITGAPPHAVARMGIAYVPQVGNVFGNLTVKENLTMAGYTLPKKRIEDGIREVTSFYPFLKDFFGRKAGTMSGGERQMLAMAMALMRKPDAMLFDEPTANLSPKMATDVLNEIKRLRDDLGITVILVEQNAVKALKRGDRAVLMVGGRVNFEGAPEDLLNSPELGSLYLGIKRQTAAPGG